MTSSLPVATPDRLELRRVRLPLVVPRRAAHGVEAVREVVVVRASGADGVVGWGECDALSLPTYTSEWQAGAWRVLAELLGPAALAGTDAGVVGHPMAAAALEMACVDLALRRDGRSLAEALGAGDGPVTSRAVVGIGSVDEVLAAVDARITAGHRALKLKIQPGHDVAVLAAVRSAWPGASVAADANGSYDLDGAVALARAVDGLDLEYVEQPLAGPDLLGAAELRRRTGVRIALDEGATGVDQVASALALGALDLVNVKPARVGGLAAAMRLRDLLVDRGVGGFCGGMYELGIARAAVLAVAAVPGLDGPADLGPTSGYVTDDLTPGLELAADGTLAVPPGPGIGPEPDPGRLDAATVEHVVVEP